MTQTCKQCQQPNRNKRSEFCSITCRVSYNNKQDAVRRPNRPICITEGCNNQVRTARSIYCKDCSPKKRMPWARQSKQSERTKESTYAVPPGQYVCYWCDKPLRADQVKVNPLNENHSDISPGNFVACCSLHYKMKKAALFFLAKLPQEKLTKFYKIMEDYRKL